MTKEKNLPMNAAIILVPDTADGFFAALGIQNYHKVQYGTYQGTTLSTVRPTVVRINPYQLSKVKLEGDLPIHMAGFGRGNCMTGALNAFIKKFEDRIVFWVDNHPGNDYILEQVYKSYYFHSSTDKYPSCISFLKKLWGGVGIKEEWVKAANFLETKIGEENAIAETYRKLMYVGRIEDASGREANFREQIRDFYFDFLLSGRSEKPEMSRLLEQYDIITAKTKKAFDNLHWSPDWPKLVLITEADGQVDKDFLQLAADGLSSDYLLVIQHQDIQGNKITTMIASKPGLLPVKYQRNSATRAFLSGQHDDTLKDIYQNLTPSIEMNPIMAQSATV